MTLPVDTGAGKWGDLWVRLVSAIVMVAVAGVEIWLGGHWFHLLIGVVCGLLVWELIRMISPTDASQARQLGGIAGAAVLLSAYLPGAFALPVLLAPVMAGVTMIRAKRGFWLAYAPVIMLAGFTLMRLRDLNGAPWLLWLVAVVVASDVLGYFAGRLLGGPKFWPRVSPKKTWSGTVAGWIGAALVGWIFAGITGAGSSLIGISVAMAMAAQMGDIAESAIKRRVGVKDASNLIPGHGGLPDPFDGMLGAAVFMLIAGQFGNVWIVS